VTQFFAHGMLMNVLASMGLDRHSGGWSSRLLAGCPGNPDNDLRLIS